MNFFIQGAFFCLFAQALAFLQKAYEFGNRNLDDSDDSSNFSFASSEYNFSSEFSLCGSVFIKSWNPIQTIFQVQNEQNLLWFGLSLTQQKGDSTQVLYLENENGTITSYRLKLKFLEWNHVCIGKTNFIAFQNSMPYVEVL